MQPKELDDKTHTLGAPADWRPEIDGPCGGLDIRATTTEANLMVLSSEWEPAPDELERLLRGAAVTLQLTSTSHPPVTLGVGEPPASDPMFDGRGCPLVTYDVREDTWPPVWNMPIDELDAAGAWDGQDKIAALADDVALRGAINVYDNCARLPGTFESVAVGVLGAFARLMGAAIDPVMPDEQLAAWGDEQGKALVVMVRQAQAVNKLGWFSGPTDEDREQYAAEFEAIKRGDARS